MPKFDLSTIHSTADSEPLESWVASCLATQQAKITEMIPVSLGCTPRVYFHTTIFKDSVGRWRSNDPKSIFLR